MKELKCENCVFWKKDLREIMSREIISNPKLTNEEMISLKAQEICDYITDD